VDIGLGLPNALPGTEGRTLISWAVDGEAAGFSTLATLDRVVYDNYDGLTALAAAAAVTERIKLTTAILIAPLWTSTALLAKQAASVDRLSHGRLVLGLAVGGRPDDFAATGANPAGRGKRMDGQLEEMRRIWSGERRGYAGGIGPVPTRPQGPPLLLGGHAESAIRRAASEADGWIGGSGGVGMFRRGADAFRAAWQEQHRQGAPKLVALAYFALGADAEQIANGYLRDYYGFAPPYAEAVVRAAAVGEEKLFQLVEEFAAAGCHELILSPCSSDVEQLKLLRSALGKN
jgi:alkanesulfonate monooxygenase SsuD/methylene tetrahydromethanopterin reductase-like flavin-dependent oxidoreductase (luciferase family)